MPTHVRVCRECGEEYRPGVLSCADCGGELEDRFEGQEPAAPPGRAPEQPAPAPAAIRALFVMSHLADLVPMADRLREAGIECRLGEASARTEGVPSRYGLFVGEERADDAMKALVGHGAANPAQAVEAGSEEEQGRLVCPACGTQAAAGTAECTECGLVLGAAEGEVEGPTGD